MKITFSSFIYNVICNSGVCFLLCLAASLKISLNINWWSFGINFAVAFGLSMIVGLFIPLVKIGRWFTGLFKVKNDTYKGNIKYRLLATSIISFIFFIVVNPSLAILNYFINNQTIYETFINWLINIPFMLLIGFISSFISDFPAYKVANKIDNEF